MGVDTKYDDSGVGFNSGSYGDGYYRKLNFKFANDFYSAPIDPAGN